jgi:CBS domain-containing protein
MDFAPAVTAVRVLTHDPPLNCPDCAVHMTQDGIALQVRGFSHHQPEVIPMQFRSVATHLSRAPAVIPPRRNLVETSLTDEDPALVVMVDFHGVCPVTVEPDRSIDEALQHMIGARVRTLLVIAKEHVIGLITAYDIQGEKPLQFLRGSDCIHPKCRHEDIEVADIMTAVAALPILQLEDVRKARIGDILQTFRETRQTHLLVAERQDGERTEIRGLISRAEIERRLGISQVAGSAARTELETSMFSRLLA